MQARVTIPWGPCRSRIVLEDVVIMEVVFFGRLELKKGLVLFCDTLDQLSRDPAAMEGIKVTFLGRIPEAAEERLMMRGGERAPVPVRALGLSRKCRLSIACCSSSNSSRA